MQDCIFCKINYGEFGGLYRRATLTGLSRKVDFFTFASDMVQKFELSQRNMLDNTLRNCFEFCCYI